MPSSFPRLSFSRFGDPASAGAAADEHAVAAPRPAATADALCPDQPFRPDRFTANTRTASPCRRCGYEGVGVIVDPQSGRSTGRRALAVAGDGSWQTFVTLPEERVVWVPDDIDDASAAQIYINPLTCWVLLTQWLPLSAGDVLLLNGGGSAVSLLLAQLTALRGIRLAVVVRNLAHRPALLAAGAARY